MNITIAFTYKNLPEYTIAAYESIHTVTPYDVIFVDDWSTDETKEVMDKLLFPEKKLKAGLSYIVDPLTYSLAGKWNLAAKDAFDRRNRDAILICNNDILFHPVTIDALVNRLWKGDVGIVSAHNIRAYAEPSELGDIVVPANPTESPHPDFSCFLLSKETWDQVGEFDENFTPCYFEDNDYHYRMKQLGLLAIATTGAPYYHYGSRTQNSVEGGLCTGTKFVENRNYFVKKHGVDPATYEPASVQVG